MAVMGTPAPTQALLPGMLPDEHLLIGRSARQNLNLVRGGTYGTNG